ncbi:JAB domain-containing protein [Stenotrophomonas sp. MMGLT7]|uniref:JAB domain-containing protein n=1 Tax=Stenotrophomonas sp. MMGLT7 TaxID=2901227 RepID=UPI001E3170A8|nr:JAB domain-containing protein [Stenotrophomonas sp. MMGLT7]MCD7096947.1 JAB domain-containing protein [Stenotrophomonas sp. MMGLT7]
MTDHADLRRVREDKVLYRAASILEQRWSARAEQPLLNSPDVARDYFRLMLAGRDREHFACATLDAKLRLIGVHTLSVGTASTCDVSNREVARCALMDNACSVIVAHNHPSGDPTPSRIDIAVTYSLRDMLATIGVDLQDHIVVAARGAVSIANDLRATPGPLDGMRRWNDRKQRQMEAARKGAETRRRNRLAAQGAGA